MPVTCQTIVDRAVAFNTLNTGLTDSRSEMLSRIRADQQALFTGATSITRDRFKTTVSVTSTSDSSARIIDLSALALPCERVLRLTLNGEDVHQVDETDPEAEYAPRYFVRGQSLVEVSNDWGASGTASLRLTYAYGPTDIDPSGLYTQTVTIPDQWIDLLVLPLAIYLATKDPGRDPNELTTLQARLDERQSAWLTYLNQYGGVSQRRFDLPAPRTTEQKR
jgi:hypothetical protein